MTDPAHNPALSGNTKAESSSSTSAFSYLYGSSTNNDTSQPNPAGRDTIVASFSPHPSTTSRSSYQVTTRSPLLVATPPQVTRALSQSYPFVKAANEVMGLLTWTTKDPWESFILVCGFWAVTLYGDVFLRYGGLLVAVGIVGAVVAVQKRNDADTHPSLDDILENLTTLTTRLNIFLSPLHNMLRFISTSSSATTTATSPMLITFLIRAILISPLWFLLSVYPLRLITTNRIVLITGTLILSWHSRPAKVTRAILWRSRHIRLLSEAITGVNFTLLPSGAPPPLPPRRPASSPAVPTIGSDKKHKHRHHLHRDPERKHKSSSSTTTLSHLIAPTIPTATSISTPLSPASSSPGVKFTFTIYENQRRWLGIGWTSSLFAYERAPWTDEHLQPCPPPDEFTLPETQPGSGVKWRWVDGEDWWVEGADKVGGRESKMRGLKERVGKTVKVGEGEDEGWIYYDNKWRDGRRNMDSWGRYTRRRKWYRNAELVEDDGSDERGGESGSGSGASGSESEEERETPPELPKRRVPTAIEEEELPDYPSSSDDGVGEFHSTTEEVAGKGKGKSREDLSGRGGRPAATLEREGYS
ncbi:Pex24p-domain-containing protein [Ascobolus immersus RN42]|uniref:Pex24p-domain-containing protein n=1 Tax=Ascobolus immersus RN42 TaxID=1160509 RepID=A0A3N4HUX9_ASCIM|nr:Pex24p-domain-containing protein [Ascobolus immersus RN42]